MVEYSLYVERMNVAANKNTSAYHGMTLYRASLLVGKRL
jgi:hypothetical protein